MILTLGLVTYGLIGSLLVRPLAGHFAWKTAKTWGQKAPDYGDWAAGIFCGILCGAVWPLFLMWGVADKFSPRIGEERRKDRIAASVNATYIAQLEKEHLDSPN